MKANRFLRHREAARMELHYLSLFLFSCRENISLAVVLTFCSEGDNISDAVNLFLFVNEWLSLVPRKEVTLKKTKKS